MKKIYENIYLVEIKRNQLQFEQGNAKHSIALKPHICPWPWQVSKLYHNTCTNILTKYDEDTSSNFVTIHICKIHVWGMQSNSDNHLCGALQGDNRISNIKFY